MLDENGFKRKSYDELIHAMSEKAKELYGEEMNVSSHSVLGIFLRIIAWFLSLLYELAEKVYHSGFISQSTGVSLDRLGANNGIYRNPASVAMVDLVFTGKPNYTIGEGVRFSTEDKIQFQMIDVVKINSEGQGKGKAISLTFGTMNNVRSNTIVKQVEPTEEVFSVSNPEKAEGGTERETDKNYRERIRLSLRGNPGPPINGILTNLLSINGVRTASVVENKTMEVDKYSNPPKSVHAYVLGGVKEDVATALFESISAGIDTVGSQAVEVEDLGGFKHTVKFDYAKAVDIFVRVELTTGSKFEQEGIGKVKQTVLDYINNLTMGEEVRYSYIYPLIYQIPGIVVAEVKIGLNSTNVVSKDITLNPNESAQSVDGNVMVIENVVG